MAAWTHIAHDALSLPAGSVTWSSISGSYDHLLIMASVRSDRSSEGDNCRLGFNGNTTSGDYTHTSLLVNETAGVTSGRNDVQAPTYIGDINAASNLAETFSNVKIWVPNYANTTGFKQAFTQIAHLDNVTTNYYWNLEMDAVLFSEDTAAIDEVTLYSRVGDFVAYSTFDLYGLTG